MTRSPKSLEQIEDGPSNHLRRLLQLTLLNLIIVVLMSSAGIARAECYVHYADGYVGHSPDGSCADWCGSAPDTCEDVAAVVYNPETDHLLLTGRVLKGENREAWLVTGKKKTPIISVAHQEFLKKMSVKYPKETRNSPESQRKIKDELAAYRKTSSFNRDGVNLKSLKAFAKKSGLSIIDENVR